MHQHATSYAHTHRCPEITKKFLVVVPRRYWKANVATVPAVKSGQFGAATKAINGAIECSGDDSTIPKKRFEIYVATLTAFGVSEAPQEGGCYN